MSRQMLYPFLAHTDLTSVCAHSAPAQTESKRSALFISKWYRFTFFINVATRIQEELEKTNN